jgi:hypothetical protein
VIGLLDMYLGIRIAVLLRSSSVSKSSYA